MAFPQVAAGVLRRATAKTQARQGHGPLDVDNIFWLKTTIRFVPRLYIHHPTSIYLHSTYISSNMDSLGGSSFSGGDAYVRSLPELQYHALTYIQQNPGHAPSPARSRHAECAHAHRETQRTLLRALRPQARNFAIQGRGRLLHKLHGEVHECMEHSIEAICRKNTEGEPDWRQPVHVKVVFREERKRRHDINYKSQLEWTHDEM